MDGNIFAKNDIIEYINEGIDRVSNIPELEEMEYLVNDEDVPMYLPPRSHHLLSIYASARCFEIDERFYQGVQRMNEFENKLENLESDIAEGKIIIIDEETGDEVKGNYNVDYVRDVYFNTKKYRC